MVLNKNVALSAFVTLLIGSTSVFADSEKLVNPSNNHTYQRFDTIQYTWSGAKGACAKLGAHLATITTLQEQLWIAGNLINDNAGAMWLGGTNEFNKGNWTWITGEPWAFVNWNSTEEPLNPNYLLLGGNWRGSSYWSSAGSPDNPSKTAAYICEWESVQYLTMTTVSHVIKGKQPNYALVGLNGGTYNVYLVDGNTGKKITAANIGLASNIAFKSLNETDDINNDNINDIAVLITKTTTTSALMIFSGANTKLLKTINLPNK